MKKKKPYDILIKSNTLRCLDGHIYVKPGYKSHNKNKLIKEDIFNLLINPKRIVRKSIINFLINNNIIKDLDCHKLWLKII